MGKNASEASTAPRGTLARLFEWRFPPSRRGSSARRPRRPAHCRVASTMAFDFTCRTTLQANRKSSPLRSLGSAVVTTCHSLSASVRQCRPSCTSKPPSIAATRQTHARRVERADFQQPHVGFPLGPRGQNLERRRLEVREPRSPRRTGPARPAVRPWPRRAGD